MPPIATPSTGWNPALSLFKPLPGQAPASLPQTQPATTPAATTKLAVAITRFEHAWGKTAFVPAGQSMAPPGDPSQPQQGSTGNQSLAAMQGPPAAAPSAPGAPQAGQPAMQPPASPGLLHPGGQMPGFTNPMPGAPNPLGAGTLAYGGARSPGMGKTAAPVGDEMPDEDRKRFYEAYKQRTDAARVNLPMQARPQQYGPEPGSFHSLFRPGQIPLPPPVAPQRNYDLEGPPTPYPPAKQFRHSQQMFMPPASPDNPSPHPLPRMPVPMPGSPEPDLMHPAAPPQATAPATIPGPIEPSVAQGGRFSAPGPPPGQHPVDLTQTPVGRALGGVRSNALNSLAAGGPKPNSAPIQVDTPQERAQYRPGVSNPTQTAMNSLQPSGVSASTRYEAPVAKPKVAVPPPVVKDVARDRAGMPLEQKAIQQRNKYFPASRFDASGNLSTPGEARFYGDTSVGRAAPSQYTAQAGGMSLTPWQTSQYTSGKMGPGGLSAALGGRPQADPGQAQIAQQHQRFQQMAAAPASQFPARGPNDLESPAMMAQRLKSQPPGQQGPAWAGRGATGSSGLAAAGPAKPPLPQLGGGMKTPAPMAGGGSMKMTTPSVSAGTPARAPGLAKLSATALHRELTSTEQDNVKQKEKRTLSDVIWGAGTPLPNTLSNPHKGGVLEGLVGAGLGGAAGYGLGKLTGHQGPLAAAGAVAGGAAGAAHGYLGRRRWNEDVTDLMSRLPEGATYRDYLADSGQGYDMDNLQNLRAMRYIARDLTAKQGNLMGDLAMAAPGPVATAPFMTSSSSPAYSLASQSFGGAAAGPPANPAANTSPFGQPGIASPMPEPGQQIPDPDSQDLPVPVQPDMYGVPKAAGLDPRMAMRIAPLVIGGAETASDTLGQAINNPDHPGTSAGRALVTGLGTTAGMVGGGLLGEHYGGPWGALAGTAGGAMVGGLGGAGLSRLLIPSPAPSKDDDQEKDAEQVNDNRATPSWRTYGGRRVKVIHGPRSHVNGKFSSAGRGVKKAETPHPEQYYAAIGELGGLAGRVPMTAGLLGAALGGSNAPAQYGVQGTIRGGLAGLGTGAGALAGGGLGFMAGTQLSNDPRAAIAGGLGGMALGGLTGHGLANFAMGDPPWSKRDKEAAAIPMLGKRVSPTSSDAHPLDLGIASSRPTAGLSFGDRMARLGGGGTAPARPGHSGAVAAAPVRESFVGIKGRL